VSWEAPCSQGPARSGDRRKTDPVGFSRLFSTIKSIGNAERRGRIPGIEGATHARTLVGSRGGRGLAQAKGSTSSCWQSPQALLSSLWLTGLAGNRQGRRRGRCFSTAHFRCTKIQYTGAVCGCPGSVAIEPFDRNLFGSEGGTLLTRGDAFAVAGWQVANSRPQKGASESDFDSREPSVLAYSQRARGRGEDKIRP
jgi:hypothetical protein